MEKARKKCNKIQKGQNTDSCR